MYESSDPTTSETYAWTSKMVYSVDPLNAGFFFPAGVDDRGANVLAIFFARLLTSLSRSAARARARERRGRSRLRARRERRGGC